MNSDASSLDFLDRFWSKVTFSDGCWEWNAGLRGDGYPAFHIGHGYGQEGGHVVALELANAEEVPALICVLHKCDNKKCVRPAHLFLGTNHENTRDMIDKGRYKNGRTKITGEQVQIIRSLRGLWTQKELAQRFNCSQQLISKIQNYNLRIKA